jgi:hypothetical protein
MDKHVEKMVKQFAMNNSSPSTCVRMLHRMDDCLYDVQNVANIFNKVKKSLFEEKGVDMSSTKAQQLVDYLLKFFEIQKCGSLYGGCDKERTLRIPRIY